MTRPQRSNVSSQGKGQPCGRDLLARCLRAGSILAVSSGVAQGARLLRNIILARILAPDQFGLMALVLAASLLFESLTEVGIRQAIVQSRRGDTLGYLNAAWWFSATRGVLLYALGVWSSPWIAAFYEEPGLTPLLQVAFLTMAFSGFTSPRLYVLEKRLEFGKYVWITQGAGLAGTLISLLMVTVFPNVWALVIGFVGEAVSRCLASFVFCPMRPRLLFDQASARELLRFSRGMIGLPLLTFVVMQADVFVLGKVCSRDDLGMYTLALSLAQTPVTLFSRVVQPLILPVLSEAQDDLPRMWHHLLRMNRSILLFGFPVSCLLAVFAPAVLKACYGPSYEVMSPVLAILSFYFLLQLINIPVASAYLALGRPALHRRFTMLRLVLIGLTIYPAASLYGTTGVAADLLGCLAVATGFQLVVLGRALAMPAASYAASGTEGVVVGAVLSLLAWGLCPHLPGSVLTQLALAGLLGTGSAVLGLHLIRSRPGGFTAAPGCPVASKEP